MQSVSYTMGVNYVLHVLRAENAQRICFGLMDINDEHSVAMRATTDIRRMSYA